MRILTILTFLLYPLVVPAEVVDAGANGFVIELRATVSTSPEQAYQQFVKVEEWWDGDHSWFGDAKHFSLEPVAGGCFCEKTGDRQAQHMQVTFVDPGKAIHLIGGLGPLQMMGLHGGMSWAFNSLDDGGTEIVHRYAVTGYSKDGLDKLAPVVDNVQGIQLGRLVDKLGANTD